MTEINKFLLITLLIFSVFPAYAEETLYGGTDLRREPAVLPAQVLEKKAVRASLVPRFQVTDLASAESSLKSVSGKAAWYRNLAAQLRKTLAQAETANEKDIIGRKLASVNSEAVSVLVREDGLKSYVQALKLIDSRGFFKDASKFVGLVGRAMSNGSGQGGHYYRGYALYDLKRYGEALNDFTKAMQKGKQDKHIYYHAGMCCFYLKKYSDAINYFSKNLSQDAGYAESYYYRGLSYFRTGQLTKAVDDYNAAVFLDASLAKPY